MKRPYVKWTGADEAIMWRHWPTMGDGVRALLEGKHSRGSVRRWASDHRLRCEVALWRTRDDVRN